MGVKKVVVFVLVIGEGVKIVVYNVNDDILDGIEIIVLVVLCIINVLVFLVKVLDDNFGIVKGFMIIVYVYIND